jgi:Radical SAM superfamily
MRNLVHWIVQVPFPSTSAPHPKLAAYYRTYSARLAEMFPTSFLPEGELWELPLWVAHLDGMLEAIGIEPRFLDLSRVPPTLDACIAEVFGETLRGDVVYFSPLAQNFDLTLALSRRLLREGRRTVLGGNMAPLAEAEDAALVHHGQLTPETLVGLLHPDRSAGGLSASPARRHGRISWVPSYRLLDHYRGRVPLLRINASHGCLFECAFCGDAWSRQLYLVEREALEREVGELQSRFPETRVLYVGDKTFGQAPEAVRNLLYVFARRPQFRFIVQTHPLLVTDELVAAMRRLGVVAVEMGFETADPWLLRVSRKATRGPSHFLATVERLHAAGFAVILNILGGLPEERAGSHECTVAFLELAAPYLRLFNLYNFVPYPLTPYFPILRERIFDWCFAHWREDAPPVFEPLHMSVEESWRRFLEKVDVAHAVLGANAAAAGEKLVAAEV